MNTTILHIVWPHKKQNIFYDFYYKLSHSLSSNGPTRFSKSLTSLKNSNNSKQKKSWYNQTKVRICVCDTEDLFFIKMHHGTFHRPKGSS